MFPCSVRLEMPVAFPVIQRSALGERPAACVAELVWPGRRYYIASTLAPQRISTQEGSNENFWKGKKHRLAAPPLAVLLFPTPPLHKRLKPPLPNPSSQHSFLPGVRFVSSFLPSSCISSPVDFPIPLYNPPPASLHLNFATMAEEVQVSIIYPSSPLANAAPPHLPRHLPRAGWLAGREPAHTTTWTHDSMGAIIDAIATETDKHHLSLFRVHVFCTNAA